MERRSERRGTRRASRGATRMVMVVHMGEEAEGEVEVAVGGEGGRAPEGTLGMAPATTATATGAVEVEVGVAGTTATRRTALITPRHQGATMPRSTARRLASWMVKHTPQSVVSLTAYYE